MELPVYDLVTGDFTGEICGKYHYFPSFVYCQPQLFIHTELDQTHFNTQLRRDIVSKVFHYFNVKGKVTTKLVKRVGDVSGSGKKPAP